MRERKQKERPIIEINIDSIGFEGIAIGRLDGIVHFVQGGLPGEKVKAQVFDKKKSFVKANTLEVLSASEHRMEPKCDYFGACGGCSWQHLAYSEQIKWKQRHVTDAFERIGKLENVTINETVPSPLVFNYRNKMEFSFGASRWLTSEEIASGADINRDFAFGLHVPGRFDKIIDVEACHIQPETGNKILEVIREKALAFGAAPYDYRNHKGYLKSLVLRYTIANNEIMAILVTANADSEGDERFAAWFASEFQLAVPEVTELVHAINPTVNSVAVGEIIFQKGKGYITENILGIDYRISPFSFFQTNSSQLDRFIGLIIDKAQFNGNNIAWDLYCGTGSITLPASRKVKAIYGIELVESSVNDAKANEKLNGIDNAEFYAADLHSAKIPELLNSLPKPDTIIVDPPRAGMNANLINHVLEIAPERIVYVSCNPATQARDLELLNAKYDVIEATPVDMFPHTFHIESVAVLTKRN